MNTAPSHRISPSPADALLEPEKFLGIAAQVHLLLPLGYLHPPNVVDGLDDVPPGARVVCLEHRQVKGSLTWPGNRRATLSIQSFRHRFTPPV